MKILITGPESSGKTTLSNRLSSELEMPLYEDFSRTFLERNGKYYTYKDLLKISFLYVNHIDIQDKESYIQDTFLVNVKIWSLYKYGKCHPYIDVQLGKHSFDCVLLMKPDLEWKEDPFRENKEDRDQLFLEYVNAFEILDWEYHIIEGEGEDRYNMAKKICAQNKAK